MKISLTLLVLLLAAAWAGRPVNGESCKYRHGDFPLRAAPAPPLMGFGAGEGEESSAPDCGVVGLWGVTSCPSMGLSWNCSKGAKTGLGSAPGNPSWGDLRAGKWGLLPQGRTSPPGLQDVGSGSGSSTPTPRASSGRALNPLSCSQSAGPKSRAAPRKYSSIGKSLISESRSTATRLPTAPTGLSCE